MMRRVGCLKNDEKDKTRDVQAFQTIDEEFSLSLFSISCIYSALDGWILSKSLIEW